MTPRITSAHVQVSRDEHTPAGRVVHADVQGQRQRHYFVDLNPDWSADWLCTCGHAPDCAHVRATKEALT